MYVPSFGFGRFEGGILHHRADGVSPCVSQRRNGALEDVE
jgi:hypothetical protein